MFRVLCKEVGSTPKDGTPRGLGIMGQSQKWGAYWVLACEKDQLGCLVGACKKAPEPSWRRTPCTTVTGSVTSRHPIPRPAFFISTWACTPAVKLNLSWWFLLKSQLSDRVAWFLAELTPNKIFDFKKLKLTHNNFIYSWGTVWYFNTCIQSPKLNSGPSRI